MSQPPFLPEDPVGTEWDVVVVGAGMGGATLGHALARRGHRVLFLEKGLFLQRDPDVSRGDLLDQGEDPQTRLRRGRWPFRLEGTTSFGALDFYAPLGCGTGGSSALYAATLERLHPSDFRPRANFPEVADSSLPEAWPITYEELEPFYRRAEELFRVRGTPDPLAPDDGGPLLEPPPLADRDRSVRDLLVRKGLHPYRVHIGCELVPGCAGCGGVVCPRACKSDAGWISLVPAIEQHGARLLPQCEVSRLDANDSSVTSVRCRFADGELSIRARAVVLAAGALMTPILLLNSRSEAWPEGLANRSGLVGRNLMMHSGDTIAMRPDRRGAATGRVKSLALNDFYFCEGRKLGNLQGMGLSVSTGNVLAHLRTVVDRNPTWWARLARPLLRVGARLGAFYFRNDLVFASIVEDLPYPHNRVIPDPKTPSGMRFEYHYSQELRERNALLRRKLSQALGRGRVFCLTAENNLNFGHPCGTCRFGDDPEASVLDRDNRAHGIENLYVVDASFFPSSGGVNPSLTIAANALRVADVIDRRLA